jgi:hypothetical protein
LNVTAPFPLPVAPVVTVIHELLLVAVHAQPFAVKTETEKPFPPPAATDCEGGLSEKEHGAAWLTVNVSPAIVSVPVRAMPVFAATLYPTDPLPLPLLPEVTVSHEALLLAVHVQPLAVVTATERLLPPPATTDWVVGLMKEAQGDGAAVPAAGWTAVTGWPPTIRVPVRNAPALAPIENETVPLPAPLLPDVMTSHGASLTAVHAHPAVAVTATEPVPPPAAIV